MRSVWICMQAEIDLCGSAASTCFQNCQLWFEERREAQTFLRS